MTMLASLLTLENVLAAAIVVALIGYALFGGADFGGGVWDMLASGPRRDRQREVIADAISPIWEANHVWLIVAIVLLFTCFPRAFALLGITLHIPLSLMLIGIVMRGSAFTFRSYDVAESRAQERWGRTFAIASVITPILLGVVLGSVASGRLMAPQGGSFADIYVRPWLSPFALAVGVFALVMFAYLAAVYLTVETESDAELQNDFRRRALAAAAALFVAAVGTLLVALAAAPRVVERLTLERWAIPLHALTALAAITAIWALWSRRFRLARVAAAAQVTLILSGWALAQFPYVIPPSLTISAAAAPPRTLELTLIALVAGSVVLFPSLYYLFRVFKGGEEGGGRREENGSGIGR
jgi:cytochrome d ubiquinol oxidase subunit II